MPLLEAAGCKTLRDILDLEREDLLKVAGMSPEVADQLLSFLTELTEESDEGGEPTASAQPTGEPDTAPEAPSPGA